MASESYKRQLEALESFDDWAIEWIDRPSFGTPCLHVTDRGATGVEDGPSFYSAQEVDRFIQELRVASNRAFGNDREGS